MLQKPSDWDQAESYDTDFERLPVGGYVVEIKKAEEILTATGKKMFGISFDIAEGDYKDYFTKQYKRDKAREMTSGREAKWRGTYRVFEFDTEGKTNGQYKAVLVCVEKSNYRYKIEWPLNLDTLKGMKVGLLFREEEYEDYTGQVRTSVKACGARTVECIQNGDYNTPAKKSLNKANAITGGAQAHTTSSNASGASYATQQGFTETTDFAEDDLPF